MTRKMKELMWSTIGCIVFMATGLVFWRLLCVATNTEQLCMVAIALVNFIGFMGHSITGKLIRKFVKGRE